MLPPPSNSRDTLCWPSFFNSTTNMLRFSTLRYLTMSSNFPARSYLVGLVSINSLWISLMQLLAHSRSKSFWLTSISFISVCRLASMTLSCRPLSGLLSPQCASTFCQSVQHSYSCTKYQPAIWHLIVTFQIHYNMRYYYLSNAMHSSIGQNIKSFAVSGVRCPTT